MAKYVPMELLKSLHGKICSHSDMYFAERYGTKYTGKICNPRTSEPSEAEAATRSKFAQVQSTIATLSEQEKSAYQEAWKKQVKYRTLRGYIFAQEYKKL